MEFNTQELGVFANTTKALLAIIDEKGAFLKLNDRWSEEFGLPMKEIQSHSVFHLIPDREHESFQNTLKGLSEDSEVSRYNFRFVGRDSKIHILETDLKKVDQRIFIRAMDVSRQDKEHRALAQISKMAHTGAWFHNPISGETHWSEECFQVLGLEADTEITEELVLSLFEEPYRQELKACIDRLYQDFESYEHLGKIRDDSGKSRWIKTVAKPIIDNERVIYINGITSDVTERQELIEELQEYVHLRDLALRGIRSGLFYHDLKHDLVTYGIEFMRMLGIPAETQRLPEEQFRALIPEEDREAAFQRHLAELKSESPYYFNFYRLMHADGSVQHYEVYAWKEFDDSGAATRMVGNLINVNERVEAQKQLKKYLHQLEAIVNNGFTYTFLLDPEGSILIADEGSIEFIINEFSLHPLSRKTHFTEVIPKSFEASFLKEFERALNGFTIRKELERVLESGVSRWLDIMYSPIKDDNGEPTTVLLMFSDITDRKVAEVAVREARMKAEQLNALKDSILSNLSHEIRTPLNGIMGGVSILDQSELDEHQREVLKMLSDCGERLLGTLTSLVNLGKARSDMSTLPISQHSLTDLVTASFNRHQHFAAKKKLEFTLDPPKKKAMILVNQEMFNVALDHLINNALKYTKTGSVTVDAKAKKKEGMAEISVTDTGVGINEVNLGKIFEDFVQESSGLDRRFEGTGIGLSLTKRFVEQMGGTISVASQIDKGSRFTIKIPTTQ